MVASPNMMLFHPVSRPFRASLPTHMSYLGLRPGLSDFALSGRFDYVRLIACVLSLLVMHSCALNALAAPSKKASAPANPSDDEVLKRWTPGGNTNASDLPYRHRYTKYEGEADSDWVDGRWQDTNGGPFFTHATEIAGQPMRPKNMTLFLNAEKSVAAMFDLNDCGIRTVARAAQLKIDPSRFGLLRKPKLVGEFQANIADSPLWTTADKNGNNRKPASVSYRGLRLHDSQTLLEYNVGDVPVAETLWLDSAAPAGVILRQFEVGPDTQELSYWLIQGERNQITTRQTPIEKSVRRGDNVSLVALIEPPDSAKLVSINGGAQLRLAPRDKTTTITCVLWQGSTKDQPAVDKWRTDFKPPSQIAELRTPAGRRWGEPLSTAKIVSTDANEPYVLDDFPTPLDNPHKALFFCSGIDFFEDGTAAVCTVHGDVWLIRGLADPANTVTWQRFATGLYQPLGLKIMGGQIIVLGNNELTRLHDLNNDGEADWYESLNHDIKTFGQDHAFAMRLEADAEGRLYFLKAGAAPDGGALYRLSANAKKLERIATGFRHPFGMGLGPAGQVTVADSEGNWIPSSKIDLITPGGFYGFVDGDKPPADGQRPLRPLCYIPKVADNSCGGQIWITSDRWGDYHRNEMLHFSWGRCTMHAVLQQDVKDVHQAATVEFPNLKFTSGPAAAAFNPIDGQLYVVGLKGWQCAATRDGCLTRVRATGKPARMPSAFEVHKNGILIRFTEPLEAVAAAKRENYRVNQWNYRWTKDYGSYHYSVTEPDQVGHDAVAVDRARLLDDGKSVFLEIRGVKPVDQVHVHADLYTKDSHPLTHDIYGTINAVAEPFDIKDDGLDLPFAQDNLVAWCIVPFDAKHRGPAQRVEMLKRLGLRRVAYDWRDEHIPQFDEELSLYKKNSIDLVGFWTPVNTDKPLDEPQVAKILEALKQNEMHTQLWVMPSESLLKEIPASKQVDHAAKILRLLAEKAQQLGCTIGLYNHGGWFGNVDHQIAIIKRLERDAVWNVGIVYNLHHGHHELAEFPALLTRMQPYLYALNLNGMKTDGPKILPIGQGDDDAKLLTTIKASGYRGPIGILNHREDTDAEVALHENITGLQKLLAPAPPATEQKTETTNDNKEAKEAKSAAGR